MGYYKLIANEQIVDAVLDPVWVREQKNGVIARCDLDEAMGIVASDDVTIYHVLGLPQFPTEAGYDEVAVADITADEYDELKTLLDLGAEVSDEQVVEWPEEEAAQEEVQDDGTLEEVKARKLEVLSLACREEIFQGVDVTLSDGTTQHFDLQLEDQLNLLTLSKMVKDGATQVPYHASDCLCAYYSAEDFELITAAASAHKAYHTAYYNSLKNWVSNLRSIAKVGAVQYGDEIPEKYRSEVYAALVQKSDEV
jgi:hypothetical protein